MKRPAKTQSLHDLIAPAVAACGVELWGVEFLPQGRRSLLRVYIDRPEAAQAPVAGADAVALPAAEGADEGGRGVGVEDCVRVTHQVSGVLDVHDPINGEYALEVSSPGWDRPFFELEQMRGYLGQRVALRLISPVAGRRRFEGTLQSVQDGRIEVLLEGQVQAIEADNIDRANLIYQD